MPYFSSFIAPVELTHTTMLVIICAKFGKNPSRTVRAVERRWKDVPYFESFIAPGFIDTHPHASDYLRQIWK